MRSWSLPSEESASVASFSMRVAICSLLLPLSPVNLPSGASSPRRPRYALGNGTLRFGGGFSPRLVAGLALVLRYLAGGSTDPGAVIAIRPPVLMGVGLTVAVLTALAPVPFGAPVLSSAKFAVPLGPLGELEIVTSLFLDVGVYLLIVGVVLDLLRALGSGIERDMRGAGEAT